MKRVVIINDSGQNFSQAKGEKIVLTRGRLNLGDISKLIFNLKEKLDDLKDSDLYILTGPSILNIIVGHYVLKKFGVMNVLALSKNKQEFVYRVQTIKDEVI